MGVRVLTTCVATAAIIGLSSGVAEAAPAPTYVASAPAVVTPVASPEAWTMFGTTAPGAVVAGLAIGGLTGAAVGAIAGGIISCVPTLPVCPVTGPAGALTGAIIGGAIGAGVGAAMGLGAAAGPLMAP